jgi:hypothetical protein
MIAYYAILRHCATWFWSTNSHRRSFSFFLDFCPERLIRIILKFHSYVLHCIASCFCSNCFSIYRICNGKFHTSVHTKKPTEGIDAKTRKLLTNWGELKWLQVDETKLKFIRRGQNGILLSFVRNPFAKNISLSA